MQQQQKIHVKIQHNNEFRRFIIEPEHSINDLKQSITTILHIDTPYTIRYLDEENEWITIDTDAELQTGIELSKSLLRLRIDLSETSSSTSDSESSGEKRHKKWKRCKGKRRERGDLCRRREWGSCGRKRFAEKSSDSDSSEEKHCKRMRRWRKWAKIMERRREWGPYGRREWGPCGRKRFAEKSSDSDSSEEKHCRRMRKWAKIMERRREWGPHGRREWGPCGRREWGSCGRKRLAEKFSDSDSSEEKHCKRMKKCMEKRRERGDLCRRREWGPCGRKRFAEKCGKGEGSCDSKWERKGRRGLHCRMRGMRNGRAWMMHHHRMFPFHHDASDSSIEEKTNEEIKDKIASIKEEMGVLVANKKEAWEELVALKTQIKELRQNGGVKEEIVKLREQIWEKKKIVHERHAQIMLSKNRIWKLKSALVKKAN